MEQMKPLSSKKENLVELVMVMVEAEKLHVQNVEVMAK
jgi:hypothetical protein